MVPETGQSYTLGDLVEAQIIHVVTGKPDFMHACDLIPHITIDYYERVIRESKREKAPKIVI